MDYPHPPANMPEPVSYEVGSKIVWNHYATEEEAKIASAYFGGPHAQYRLSQGFDFGYQVPGTITPMSNGTWCVIEG
jgi:hypothetical protein